MRSRVPSVLLTAAFGVLAFGQTSARISSGPDGFRGSAHFSAPRPFEMVSPVAGAPYSAEEVNEQVRTLADGTHITQKQASRKIFRDSLGRTRIERPLFRGGAVTGQRVESPLIVEITDPVAQVKYTLDTINKVAHRQRLLAPKAGAARTPTLAGTATARAAAPPPVPVNAARPQRIQPERATENLGTQNIEGVLAEGVRTTNTWPVGSQGNDRPISVVTETWRSPALKTTVLTTTSDPRNGESTVKLTNISQAEPSADLFQAPSDYSIADEEGEFTINWGAQ